MSILAAKKTTYIAFAITVLISLILPFFSHNLATTALFLLIIYWGLLTLALPRFGLFFILLLRPCLDLWSGLGIISVGEANLNLAGILSLILLLISGLLLMRHHRALSLLPLRYSWLAFLSLAGLSIIWSIYPTQSLAEFLRLASIFALFFYAFIYIKSEQDLERLLLAVSLSGLVPSSLALYQYAAGTGLTMPFEGIYNRIYGTFAHPNLLAYYLVLTIMISLYFVLKERRDQIKKLVFTLLTGFYALVLVLTFTRGAWLALVIALGVIGTFRYRLLLLSGLVLMVFSYFAVGSIHSRINDLINNPYSSIDWRQDLWNDARGYVKEQPLLGQGTGVAKDFIAQKRGPEFGSSDPHNDYLKVLLENGYLGLIFYLSLQLGLLYQYLRALGKQRQSILYLILLGLTLSFTALGYVDNILRNTALAWAFWALNGAALKLYAIKKPVS